MIGVLYWRSQEDENFLKTLSEACLPPAESTDQVRERGKKGKRKNKRGWERDNVKGGKKESRGRRKWK